uniref:Uncharacterized protein n=1 Tax=Opuntia streptacantha TaxID=393608 RepID=A0A7C9EY35_OPUST
MLRLQVLLHDFVLDCPDCHRTTSGRRWLLRLLPPPAAIFRRLLPGVHPSQPDCDQHHLRRGSRRQNEPLNHRNKPKCQNHICLPVNQCNSRCPTRKNHHG